jgi:hypothetical protein
MPNFAPNLSKVAGTITVLPKDSYEFIIGEPKAYLRQNKKQEDMHGVQYPLKVVGGPMDGKMIYFSAGMHNDGSAGATKRFMMAAYGFEVSSDNEKLFDETTENLPQGYNTDDKSVEDFWRRPVGTRILADVDQNVDPNDSSKVYQQFVAWYPVTA